jgi:hypothetical protein
MFLASYEAVFSGWDISNSNNSVPIGSIPIGADQRLSVKPTVPEAL